MTDQQSAMGTLNAMYVRAADASAASALAAEYAQAYTEPGTQFFVVDQPVDRFRCPESELMTLSERLKTDVIWLGFRSGVDAFQFHRWRGGKHLRSLVYGYLDEARTWERVEGWAEPWEDAVLFDRHQLVHALQYIEDEGERLAVESIYRDRKIMPGHTEPSLDAREIARRVAKFFHLPGWGLAEAAGR
jgi:hypothetical protein